MAANPTGAGTRRSLEIWAWREDAHAAVRYTPPGLAELAVPPSLSDMMARYHCREEFRIPAVGRKDVAITVYSMPETGSLPMRYLAHLRSSHHDQLIFTPTFPSLLELLRFLQPRA